MAQRLRVTVIGGGAAGFFGAIAAAEANPEVQVTLLEAGAQPLSKVRISGGGRCNVTHHCFDPALLVQHYPRGGRALRGAFTRFQPQDTVAWYRRRGVRLKTEADGRMFPTTDDSGTIVDCLMRETRRVGVTLRTQAMVKAVRQVGETFVVELKAGETLTSDRLLLATGSNPQGHRLAASLGHTIVPPVPSLFTFNIPDRALRELAGVAVDPVEAKLMVPGAKPLTQTGPLLITHWGLSGPAVLKLSAWGARLLHDARYQATLQVNWLPSRNAEQVRQDLLAAKQTVPKRAIANHCPFDLPKRLWRYWLQQVGVDDAVTWANLSKKTVNQLVDAIARGHFTIQGKGVFKDEFVTCGGVKLSEVDFKTMASRRCQGLYLAGEVLDIDGVTGGFNFQSAWTTGWLAGQAIAAPNRALSKQP
ncbi:BaiN/RdsA family NAD(P)/FAD-dependent oxidoreductase [Leptolyngbya iicbica]|uniref:NAD(P)/FAD-dependent oxidoreductase n=2 Tax=Cyanophyceae TaxID=3028117 RepID=A0A4Q7E221_9CYAN|nr:NAD(P)/FAD-dependent oxidoreductase [Leptolyngbya sp. LK]RZM75026.1 NAD(P)/FAD-dependent oxidoreductase [Leptolyngbya sp. LK]